MSGEKKVKFVFSCEEKHSADMKTRLRFDGLSQSIFFSTIMEMYISGDPVMYPVVEKIKNEKTSIGKRKIKKWKEDISSGMSLLNNLGMTEHDKQKIFDIIEQDLGEEYE